MKKQMSIMLILLALFVSAFTGIQQHKESVSTTPEAIYIPDTTKVATDTGFIIREADLFSEDWEFDPLSSYSEMAPGTSTRYERSFENAPPMIPHSTEGLLPITKDLNMCITCHMPIVAVAMKSTPIPQSHFTKYRPEIDPADVDRSDELFYQEDLNGQLDKARYDCSLCHVPQAKVTVVFENNFLPDFRKDNAASNSNFHENAAEGIK